MNWRVELAQTESYLSATRSQPSCSNFVKASLIAKIEGRNCEVEREIRAKTKSMTKEERSVLEALDKIVQSEKVRAKILPIAERVRADLARKPGALMTWEPVALETFGALPPAIRSGWGFILRAGSDTGAERHPNSHQRMMSFEATGDWHIAADIDPGNSVPVPIGNIGGDGGENSGSQNETNPPEEAADVRLREEENG